MALSTKAEGNLYCLYSQRSLYIRADVNAEKSTVEGSINVWLVSKSKYVNSDYHGHFTAEEFEQLFKNLCKSLDHYGNCMIHMDGAFCHKRQPCT
jgi:uncharacterized protein with WD repeat